MWTKLKAKFSRKETAPAAPRLTVANLLKTRQLEALIAGAATEGPERQEYFDALRRLVDEYHDTRERPKHIALPQFRWQRGKAAPRLLLNMGADETLPVEMRRVSLWALEKIDDAGISAAVREYVEQETNPTLRRVGATILARPIGKKLLQVANDIEQRSPTEVPLAEDGFTRIWTDRQCRLLQRDYVQLLAEPLSRELDSVIVLSLLNRHSEFGLQPDGDKRLTAELQSAFAELQLPMLLRRLWELHQDGDECERAIAAKLLPLVCGGVDVSPEWDDHLSGLPEQQRRELSRLAGDALQQVEALYHPLRGRCADVPARAVLRLNIAADFPAAAQRLRDLAAEAPEEAPVEMLSNVERLAFLLDIGAEQEVGEDSAGGRFAA